MFKRAVISDEISQDFSRAVAVVRRFKLDGIELRSVWDKNPHELTRRDVLKIKNMVGNEGLTIPCLDAPLFKCHLNEVQDYQAHLEILKRSIAVAQELGIGIIRGFSFWDEGDFAASLPVIVPKIKAVESILDENEMVLAIESDPATAANTSQKLEVLLKKIAGPRIKAVWDPGNNLYVPGAEKPYPDGYERLKPYIAHIHIKDIGYLPDGKPTACAIGTGAVDYAQIFKRLTDEGYQEWLSLETHYRLHSGPLFEKLLALPKGTDFSRGGETATIESLQNWGRMLQSEGQTQ
jgi:L-ribulose-5-phosphate 3-epimerase